MPAEGEPRCCDTRLAGAVGLPFPPSPHPHVPPPFPPPPPPPLLRPSPRLCPQPRDEAKWARAIEGSYLLVHAKLLATGDLVAFARATSDQALNGTVWDVVVDPSLPDVVCSWRRWASSFLVASWSASGSCAPAVPAWGRPPGLAREKRVVVVFRGGGSGRLRWSRSVTYPAGQRRRHCCQAACLRTH